MQTKIINHKIEYRWDDGQRRELDEQSLDIICEALLRKHTKGRLSQNDGGVSESCSWEDITDDDLLAFGLTQGWFK